MYQGLLGAFPFTVTELEVSTFRDLKFSREQVYAEHRVLAGIPCLQHMGRNLWSAMCRASGCGTSRFPATTRWRASSSPA